MIKIRSSTADLFTAVILLAAIGYLFVLTFSLAPSPVKGYPGAAFFPRLVLVGTGLFAALWLGLVLLGRLSGRELMKTDEPYFDFEYKDYIISIVAVLAYIGTLDFLGFEIGTFALLAFLLWPRIGALAAAGAAALTTLVLYGTFVLLLNVSVPLLFLPRYVTF
ncbi:tripartite tricarboxylate transporter TctB family protein [Pseudochelatococcus sp. B33]